MKTKDLEKKSLSELEDVLAENREKVRKLRFDLFSGKLKNHREIREVKKEIARILTTITNKRELKQ